MSRSGAPVPASDRAQLVSLLDREEALRAALALLVGGPDVAWLAAPGPGGELVLRHVLRGRTTMLRGLRVPSGFGLTGKVSRTARPAWVNDYFASADITHTFDQHIHAEGIQRLPAVPVVREDRMLGVLAVGVRDPGVFSDRILDHAGAVADQLALAVAVAERARLAREVAVHEERRRMAAELHDSVGALLFAIGSGAAGIAASAAGDPELAARVEQLQRHAASASTALRASMRALRASPSALALSVALREDCRAAGAGDEPRRAVPRAPAVEPDLAPVPHPAGGDRRRVRHRQAQVASAQPGFTLGRWENPVIVLAVVWLVFVVRRGGPAGLAMPDLHDIDARLDARLDTDGSERT